MNTSPDDRFIAEARANIAKHEANILAALNRGDFATADRLGRWRDALVIAIAKRTT